MNELKKFSEIKLSKEVFDDIIEQRNPDVEKLFLTEEEFKLLENPSFDLKAYREGEQNNLKICYENIKELLNEYCDLRIDYYPIVTTWIIGTYFHDLFISYPYLFY